MQFLRNLLSTIVGLIVFTLIFIFVIISVAGINSEVPEVKTNSVLKIQINHNLVDRPNSSEFNFANSAHCGNGLLAIQQAINSAKEDSLIKAIYLEIGDLKGSLANVTSLKRTIESYRKTGRKVIVHSDGLSQIGYYLAVSADSVYVDNLSFIEWKGLGAQLMYFRSMLDKIGVQAEPIRVGRFKSAVEPFILDSISGENEYQVKEMLNDIWGSILNEVSDKRRITRETLNKVADSYAYLMPTEAKDLKFIDGVKYQDEVHDYLTTIVGGELNYITVNSYNEARKVLFEKGKKVVVVNAEGAIVDADSQTDVSSKRYSKIFDDILKDNNVKAVVLRVNSPGGSALASEKLWRKLMLIKERMPLIVSMGNVAASGGYYLAAAGDTILAEKNTITGSIGVFGLMFNVSELTKSIGVNVEKVKTNEMSDFPSFDRKLKPHEKERIKTGIKTVYGTFIERVQLGRNLSKQDVEKLAEGRVWTGNQALEIGLVDSLGGLEEAIAIAVNSAHLSDYKVVHLPKEQTPLEAIVNHISKQGQISLPEPFAEYNYMIQNPDFFKSFSKPQARLPFVLTID